MPFDGDIRKTPVEICRETEGTPTAKLIAVLMAAGITDTRELAELVGVGVRAIQKANHSSQRTTVREPQFAETNHSSPNEPQFANHSSPLARANKESPSEINIPNDSDSPLVPQQPAKPLKLRSQGSRLPGDWKLPDDWRMWAKTNCFANDAQIDHEAAQFADYWIAKPSQATSLDWKRTWQKWVRKAFSPAGLRQPQHTYVSTTSDLIRQVAVEMGVA